MFFFLHIIILVKYMKIDEFKNFVRKNSYLVDYVTNKKMTWQQFYELYDLYGESDEIWNKFKKDDSPITTTGIIPVIKEIYNYVKKVDLASVQKTLTSIDKAIEAFKGFNDDKGNPNQYEERPKYKYFED